ncbi:MAG: ATP-binding protein [Chloroflexota bacterium]
MVISKPQQSDITSCDKEPIHIPGRIQAHGMIIVLSEPDLIIEQISTNVEQFIGQSANDLLGTPLATLLGDSLNEIREHQQQLQSGDIQSFSLTLNDKLYQAILHRNAQARLILELEPEPMTQALNAHQVYNQVEKSITSLENASDLDDLYQKTVAEVRQLTGFDRVKLYRFDVDWHGWVVAESKADHMPSYMDLHFPATDIPKQARALYVRNRMRLIADVHAEPAGLLHQPDDTIPIDMSDMALRAVSPIHIEYLQNMGVGASMSISILKDGVLWGLIACHHTTTLHVPYRIRIICKLLSLTVSTQLIAKEQQVLSDAHAQARYLQDDIFDAMLEATDPMDALIENTDNLLQLINASGLVIWLNGQADTVGNTPSFDQIEDIILFLKQLDRDIYSTESLSEVLTSARDYAEITSGVLAIKISQTLDQFILWLRPEQVQTVHWGGNPEKSKTITEDGETRINPRKSFEKWSQNVQQTAIPWEQKDKDAALILRSNIVDVILRRVNELKQLNLRLERSNLELDAFAYIASHDLKEPLRGIHNYSSILIRRYADQLGEDGQSKLDTLVRLTQRLDTLLDSLLHYSRVGRLELTIAETDLNLLIRDVNEALTARIQESPTEIVIPRPLPTIFCDGTQLAEVYTNLISNGIKYNTSNPKIIEIGYDQDEENTTILYIKDNGIGIPKKHQESVFRIFKRLHRRDDYGGGIGAGLTIVQKIIQRHNGTIWLESTESEGTTFYFTIETPEETQ